MIEPMNARELIANVLDRERKWPDAPETADAILSALPEIVQSMVNPLVWCPSDDKAEFYEYSTADNHSYEYEVGECDFGWFFVEHILGYECSDHFGTPDAAKAAANAHHRAQVMSAISDTPAPLSNPAATLLHELNSNPIADKGAQLAVNTWLTKLAMGDV
jgi:hypothetical protein